ncbi:uncharacterized protein BX663DRAFT_518288 [Cokeromyces recurvatus]|uniref:uncharacterized protein n=1 Tax=Cokeromyces recurvatus TaxID=90255 RepID=UPI00221F0026|nr:uncharacterized protein BX663DRAFT_518288 [Cokeromyces recurvatus]KAI7900327.1 hypothetical protein BX663DRAFT_518288 [Cokeromyces recurvatus]
MLFKSIRSVSSRGVRMSKRFTSYQTGSEGATAQSGSFGQKEKAIENQWARAHDADKLKMLHEALLKQEKETAALKKDIENLQKKHETKK